MFPLLLQPNEAVTREHLPASSLERQRRDIEKARQQIEVRKCFIAHCSIAERCYPIL